MITKSLMLVLIEKNVLFDFELNRIESVELNKSYSMNPFLYVFKLTAATVAYPCCLWAK